MTSSGFRVAQPSISIGSLHSARPTKTVHGLHRVSNSIRDGIFAKITGCEKLHCVQAVVKERTVAIKTATTEPGKPFPTKRKIEPGVRDPGLEVERFTAYRLKERLSSLFRIGAWPTITVGWADRVLVPARECGQWRRGFFGSATAVVNCWPCKKRSGYAKMKPDARPLASERADGAAARMISLYAGPGWGEIS